MAKLKIGFQAKVLLPVVAVLVLFSIGTVALINQRINNQLRIEAGLSVNAARMMFIKSLELQKKNLEFQFRTICEQPKFYGSAGTRQEKTITDSLTNEVQVLASPATAVFFTSEEGKLLASVDYKKNTNLKRLHAVALPCIDTVLQSGTNHTEIVQVDDQIFHVVTVPCFDSDHAFLGVLTAAVDLTKGINQFKDMTMHPQSHLLIVSADKIVFSTLNRPELSPALLRFYVDHLSGGRPEDVPIPDGHFMGLPGHLPGVNAGFLLLSSYDATWKEFQETRRLLIDAGIFGAILGSALVWLLVRKASQPLHELRKSADALSRGDFSRRIKISSNDELGALAKTFNQMTENLERSISELETTVDKLKTTQAQLVQSEKLSAIGEFVAGVAHELNNPLTTMLGYTELLQNSKVDDQTRTSLKHLSSSAERCRKIVRSLLSFARQHTPERKAVNVNTVVDAVIEILAYELRTSNIKITTALMENVPVIIGDPHQLHQVFLNLVNNARQAIESHRSSGNIHITTSVNGSNIRIKFHDDGPGITPENLKKLFTPFFTTKPIGKGTGLGLSVSYGIIKEHGGTIFVESVPGQSTTFIIDLPIAVGEVPATVETPKLPETQPGHEGKGRKILVVDDEPSILELVTLTLQHYGYEVETLSDGKAALERLEHKRYDLTVLDFKMPGMGGQEVYQVLLRNNPDAARRVLFMTGDVLAEKTENYLREQGTLYVAKPFSLETFRNMVKKSLDQSKN